MTQADLARVLAQVPGRSKLGRKRPAAIISDGMIGHLERSEQFDLWKIARYANWTGLPVSVIMLVQELAAHLRDNRVELATEIASATKALCDRILEGGERLAGADPGPSADLTNVAREHLTKCHNKDKHAEDSRQLAADYKFFLIADELFRAYPERALRAKRGEWQQKD